MIFSNIVMVLYILIKIVKYKLRLILDYLDHKRNLKKKLSCE